MNEEIQFIYDIAKEKMLKSIVHLENELNRIRAGKANVHILDGIMVDYYGSITPLSQVANISTPDAKTIAIQPWEKKMIDLIEKAILAANIGITPMNNGELIRLGIPTLTEERRIELVKQVKNEGENAKVSIRNGRRDANDEFKQMQKDGLSEDEVKDAEDKIQEMTKDYSEQVEKLVAAKEEDMMTI